MKKSILKIVGNACREYFLIYFNTAAELLQVATWVCIKS